MPRLQRKSFARPDRVRALGTGHIETVDLDEAVVGRVTLPPGWRWATDVQPVVGTSSCEVRHVSFAISGRLHVLMDDGTEMDIDAGDVHEIPPGHDAWVVGDEPYLAVEWANSGRYGEAPDASGERVLATILFTDIVDSTAVLGRVGDAAWRTLIVEHNARLRRQLDAHRGREVTTTGDGILAIFDSPARAVRCAAAIDPAVEDLGLRVRAGAHTGEVEIVAGSPRGFAVHAAARIAALAGAGEVLVSATTRDLLEGSDLAFDDRGDHELKGIGGSRRVFALIRPLSPVRPA
jgi:class 3 adenylate cyclase